jgi:hypothetical protein
VPPTQFSIQGFAFRLAAALVLVFATYNTAGWSYYHWALTTLSDINPFKAFAGLLLLTAWVIFIRATLRSLGAIGIGLVTALFATVFWMIIDWGIVSTDNINAVTFVTQIILCLILAIGMSWSHVRRRLSGQMDADDVGD